MRHDVLSLRLRGKKKHLLIRSLLFFPLARVIIPFWRWTCLGICPSHVLLFSFGVDCCF